MFRLPFFSSRQLPLQNKLVTCRREGEISVVVFYWLLLVLRMEKSLQNFKKVKIRIFGNCRFEEEYFQTPCCQFDMEAKEDDLLPGAKKVGRFVIEDLNINLLSAVLESLGERSGGGGLEKQHKQLRGEQ